MLRMDVMAGAVITLKDGNVPTKLADEMRLQILTQLVLRSRRHGHVAASVWSVQDGLASTRIQCDWR